MWQCTSVSLNSKRKLSARKLFQQVARYKINIHKAIASLYTNDKFTEKDIREIPPFFTINSKISWG